MNDIINKFLLAGDKFIPEMHLKQPAVFNKNKKQPGFTYSSCGQFTKNKLRIKRFIFQHDMAYGDFKDLKRRTQSDKVLKYKAFAWISKRISFNGL